MAKREIRIVGIFNNYTESNNLELLEKQQAEKRRYFYPSLVYTAKRFHRYNSDRFKGEINCRYLGTIIEDGIHPATKGDIPVRGVRMNGIELDLKRRGY